MSGNSELSQKQRVYLALGGNISPRGKYIHRALKLLQNQFPREFRISDLYLTKPFQDVGQSSYYNCCAGFQTDCSAIEVLESIADIEHRLGRRRNEHKWEARIIDLDIIFFKDEIIDLSNLTVPHYDVSNRDFFLIPLLDLDMNIVNPRTKEPVKNALARIPRELRTDPVRIKGIAL